MKGIIILAVSSFLVGVHASLIPTVRMELEDIKVGQPWMLENKEVGSELNNDVVDVTSAIDAVDEIQGNNDTIPRLCFNIQKQKNVMDSIRNAYHWSLWSACYTVSYLPWSAQFLLEIWYRDNYSSTNVQAEDVKYCLPRPNAKVCIELKNMKQAVNIIYTDVTLSEGVLSKTFYNVCFLI
ncbi:hypothetical protein CHS0354_038360 [Potamilus streckersoni]|uniref:Uncharacterized protein n=1 Tax=Potamilus streckersoni TaxID=2493646 RepID=A0AAE0S6K2_9BIVA|nr:hypothetical protein CHS0354_038360 [Potamilus streckersoni]